MHHMSKYIQIDDWIFEIKAVRALRVPSYGQPYTAIANISINGESAHVDGLMTKEEHSFTRNDFDQIINFCRVLDLSSVNFERYKNQIMRSETVALSKPSQDHFLKVVS